MLYVEIAIVAVLICVNGPLSMSELAIVSSRPARLKAMIDRNIKGAGRALALGSNPGKFLSSVQIGITLIAILSGAYSGEALGGPVSERLERLGMVHDHAGQIDLAAFTPQSVSQRFRSLFVEEYACRIRHDGVKDATSPVRDHWSARSHSLKRGDAKIFLARQDEGFALAIQFPHLGVIDAADKFDSRTCRGP